MITQEAKITCSWYLLTINFCSFNDFPNIKAAWSWAINTNRLDDIADHARLLSQVFDSKRRLEMEQVFAEVVDRLNENNPSHQRALGYALVLQYTHNYTNPSTWPAFRKGLAMLRQLGDTPGIIMGLRYAHLFNAESSTEEQVYREGLQLARECGDAENIAFYLQRKTQYERSQLPFEQFKRNYDAALPEVRAANDPILLAKFQAEMALALLLEHQYAEAIVLMEETIDLSERLGLHNYHAVGVNSLADTAFKLGRYGDALAASKKAEGLFKSTQTPFWSYQSLCLQARIYIKMNAQQQALNCLKEGLGFVKDLNNAQVCRVLLSVAEYVNAYASATKAVAILQCLIDQPEMWKPDREQVVEMIAQLEKELPPEAFQTGVKASQFYTLELLLEEALQLAI